MINSQRRRIADAAAILTLAAGSVAVRPAAARPLDPNPAPHRSIAFPDSPLNCPLRRIDRQLAQCDNLIGAGVAALLLIPEL